MKHLSISVLLVALFLTAGCVGKHDIPAVDPRSDFVDVKQLIPSVQLEIRYYTSHNFVGSRIDGYAAPKCLLTREAAVALKNVQEELLPERRSLKIFDCYRPQRAVDHFVRWAKDLNDLKMKSEFYPSVDKKNLFRDGYIAAKSGHSRGSTLDLTLIDLNTRQELDMGTNFDFFDPRSHTAAGRISQAQHENRMTLKSVMERNGFKNLAEEWWHYTLKNEPYADEYFDFKVE
jgi:zinc D-Ala-D-Ala dipeptidase